MTWWLPSSSQHLLVEQLFSLPSASPLSPSLPFRSADRQQPFVWQRSSSSEASDETRRLAVTIRSINPKSFELSDLVIDDYEKAHRNDSFASLERRAKHNRQDRGLLKQWLDLARQRERVMLRTFSRRLRSTEEDHWRKLLDRAA